MRLDRRQGRKTWLGLRVRAEVSSPVLLLEGPSSCQRDTPPTPHTSTIPAAGSPNPLFTRLSDHRDRHTCYPCTESATYSRTTSSLIVQNHVTNRSSISRTD